MGTFCRADVQRQRRLDSLGRRTKKNGWRQGYQAGEQPFSNPCLIVGLSGGARMVR
jgi:hypothetical protein